MLIFTVVSGADIPMLINYPGKLAERNGNPITGIKNIKFAFFDTETSGLEKWNGTYQVTITKGVFNILLGSGTSTFPSSLDFSINYWLEMTVEGEVLSPRQKISSVAYAMRSEYSNRAEIVNTPIVFTGSGDIAANVSEKCYIYLDKIPRLTKLYIYGEKMSTLFYTEIGGHSHTASNTSSGDHGHNMLVDNTSTWWGSASCVIDGNDTDSTRAWRPWPIQNAGSHNHLITVNDYGNNIIVAGNTNKTYPTSVRVIIDGNNKTGFIGNPNNKGYWNSTNSTWGDGIHEFSTGELNINSYMNVIGEHKIEFTEDAGGRIRYCLYIYY